MPTPQASKEDYDRIIRLFRIVLVLSVTTILIGAVFYHLVEHLSWIDSFYFCVITLATVGYGDITPHTNAGKIFTIFYVLLGIGIIATLANLTLRRAFVKYNHRSK